MRKIMAHYSPALATFANRLLVNISHVEDVLQDCFVTLWENRSRFSDALYIKRFLFVVVKNRCINLNKQDSRGVVQFGGIMDHYQDPDAVVWKVVFSEIVADIRRTAEALPDPLRNVFYLSFDTDLSIEEIADRLNLSKQTVKNRKSEIYKLLRDKFKHNYLAMLIIANAFYF